MDNDFQSLHLRGTEEVFQALEDNQVALSTMKASQFMKAFEKDVDHWERCLSLILEVIEMVLTVQRQWMYLEVSIHTAWAVPTPASALLSAWSLEIGLLSVSSSHLPRPRLLTLVSVSYIPTQASLCSSSKFMFSSWALS